MTSAQKAAQATFKKAIAYRKKTGCSLKEAFAHAKGHKVGYVKKAAKKVVKKKTIKKAAPKKKVAKKIAKHIDTKSHNVNIKVVSGIKSLGAYHENPFTLAQVKKLNPLYFAKGWKLWFGVKGNKLITSHKLGCQVYVEKIYKPYLGVYYTARNVNREGKLGDLKRFDHISELEKHVDKYIKF